MKKILVLMMAFVMVLSLAACGGDSAAPDSTPAPETSAPAASEVTFVSMTFGDITMNVPDVFSEVTYTEGTYLSNGPDSAVSVSDAMEVTELDFLPAEWDESIAQSISEMLFSETYSNIELAAFEGDVNMNGNAAVYFAFYGENSKGTERLVQVVYLFNDDQTQQYLVSLIHNADDEFFAAEVGGEIINSITLNK